MPCVYKVVRENRIGCTSSPGPMVPIIPSRVQRHHTENLNLDMEKSLYHKNWQMLTKLGLILGQLVVNINFNLPFTRCNTHKQKVHWNFTFYLYKDSEKH